MHMLRERIIGAFPRRTAPRLENVGDFCSRRMNFIYRIEMPEKAAAPLLASRANIFDSKNGLRM